MNNNPLADRNHEIYNNYNYTSDYNPGLINKNINNKILSLIDTNKI